MKLNKISDDMYWIAGLSHEDIVDMMHVIRNSREDVLKKKFDVLCRMIQSEI
jgi:hypothetical protein